MLIEDRQTGCSRAILAHRSAEAGPGEVVTRRIMAKTEYDRITDRVTAKEMTSTGSLRGTWHALSGAALPVRTPAKYRRTRFSARLSSLERDAHALLWTIETNQESFLRARSENARQFLVLVITVAVRLRPNTHLMLASDE
jgi:hypothetical protein